MALTAPRAAVLLLLLQATSAAAQASAPPADSVLFPQLVRLLAAEPGVTLRVDPRPLRPDPELVTLHAMPAEATGLMNTEAYRTPFADVPDAVLERRRAALRDLWIEEGEAPGPRCPGVLVPPRPGAAQGEGREACPRRAYRLVALALPRPGGAYWPGNVDVREKYGGPGVLTVRAIVRDLAAGGSIETSADYVFDCGRAGRCRLLEERPLLIVE